MRKKSITKNDSKEANRNALVPVGKKKYLPSVDVIKNAEGRLVTDESFGIEAVVEGRQGMMSVIIGKGTPVPSSYTRRYFPIQDFQAIVKVHCFKGEHPVADHNIKLGEFGISGLQSRTKKESKGIDITFTINKLGTILVDAIEVENPDNHLKVRLEYEPPEGLVKSVAKGVLKEVVGIFLPSGKNS